MHVDEGEALGLQVSYELLDFDLMQGGAERLPALLKEAEQRGFAGLNITYPSKQAVIPLLDELAPEARALHSVNTVLFRDGRRIGHNTDWWGFAESFRRDMSDVKTDHVVLVGAGGAGAAVGYAMLKMGSRELTVHDTDGSRSAALAQRLSELFPDRNIGLCRDLPAALAKADGLIHATPTGMRKYPGMPVPAETLRPPLWVSEIVYVPLLTELVRHRPQTGLPHARRRRHGGVPGRPGIQAVLRGGAGHPAHASPLPFATSYRRRVIRCVFSYSMAST